jgi:HSP20 family protein
LAAVIKQLRLIETGGLLPSAIFIPKEVSMANITRYSPFDELFDEFTRGYFVKPLGVPATRDLRMKLDVKESDKAYNVRAEIPGVKKEDIHVDVEGSHVSVRAEVKKEKEEKKDEKVIYSECSYGMVSRDFELPTDVDAQGAKAEYRDGVLDLTLPKKAGAAARRISVL